MRATPPRPSFAPVFFMLLSSLPLSIGALCGDTAGKSGPEIIQEQACIANYEKQDYDAAETRCELCLEYNERNAECLNGLGLIWYARGDDIRARTYYIRAARENNDFAQPRNNLGVLEFETMWFLGTSYRDILAFLLLFAILVVRPAGLAGARAA